MSILNKNPTYIVPYSYLSILLFLSCILLEREIIKVEIFLVPQMREIESDEKKNLSYRRLISFHL